MALAQACGSTSPTITAPTPGPTPVTQDTTPPAIVREARGVWIATVANIDWPTRSTLSADQQRAELVDLMDRAAAARLNTVVFHIRPAGDAVYRSTLEPWAAMLTGVQGKDPGFDPLALAVDLAHARGMELHAWINPFRAGNTRDTLLLAATHQFNTHRDRLRIYGSQVWFDPGENAVQDHVMNVVRDIVQRYDVDAIHADDYFYPYVENDATGKAIPFPDSATYVRSGSTLSRDDWRRSNVDRFIERMSREVHALKPALKVGISPFGIWRPGNPAGVNGLDAYASIYADSRKWLQQGWVDYLAPQLYWSIAAPQQSFPALLDWWMAQNPMGRHVWPGLAAYRVADGTTSAFTELEIPNQVKLIRARPTGTGFILYNGNTTLKRNSGATAAAIAATSASPALVPASPWLDAVPPGIPTIVVSGRQLRWTPASGEAARWWVVRVRTSTGWTTQILFGDQNTLTITQDPERVLLNAADQAGNLGGTASWTHP